MDELIVSFLDFTGTSDETVAKQYLDLTGNNLEYAVQLFMENGGPVGGDSGSNDAELAERLQQEAYGNDEVREADSNIHRHETLVDSFDFVPPSRPTDIFGSGRIGIFNQRFDDEANEYFENRSEDEDDSDESDEIIELDSDGEVIERPRRPGSRRRRVRQERINELNSTQRRLANLFRPPFDIMQKVDIDGAKTLGRSEKKWILVNIQDATEFVCQVLNRDFWSNDDVKRKVKENFIFLQYQHDSPNGERYKNFYTLEKYPHISILDPLTGERVYKFTEGEVPNVEEWLEEVDEFLNKFSIFGANNPTIHHEKKFNPEELTEEQQIEYAMKQSMGNSNSESQPPPEVEEEQGDVFDRIEAKDHEVDDSEPTTRLQIRFPNGKRLVHKFKLSDTIETIYSWLKFAQEDYARFNLSNASDKSFKMIDSLQMTLEESKLKNASILLESE
ncbi:UBX domain-containing protein 5 [[Candida] jaroonii]|uniref:UBX domain-containing protein 5 n=1 Tax=[Candida] jaroonii TaxID=467808 RepID=A0ACA9Y805_9ASCO|nr:UBX domain-containing protein 5 [[Candida] jaroonii]